MLAAVLFTTIAVLLAVGLILSLVIVIGCPRQLPFRPFETTIKEMATRAKTGDLILFRLRKFHGMMWFTFFTHVGVVVVGSDGKKRLLETNPWWSLTPGVPFGDTVLLPLEHRVRTDTKIMKTYYYPLLKPLSGKRETDVREAVKKLGTGYPSSAWRFVSVFTRACVRRKKRDKNDTLVCSQLVAEALRAGGLADPGHSCIMPDHFLPHPAYGGLYEIMDETSDG
jgi:hypothetical protein